MKKLLLYQKPYLFSMMAIGFKDDIFLANGVHLRWSFAKWLGFPEKGFILYRRIHNDKEALNHKEDMVEIIIDKVLHSPQYLNTKFISFQAGPFHFSKKSEWITLTKTSLDIGAYKKGVSLTSQPLIIQFHHKDVVPWFIGLDCAQKTYSGSLAIKIYQGRSLKETITLTSGRRLRSLTRTTWVPVSRYLYYPDHGIDRIEITGQDAVLWKIIYLPESWGWNLLNGIDLPLQENFPLAPIQTIVKQRVGTMAQHLLPLDVTANLPDLEKHYWGSYGSLKSALLKLFEAKKEGKPMSGVMVNEKKASTHLLDLVLLSCLNPNLARIMGLSYINKLDYGLFDYKINAIWNLKPLGFNLEIDCSWASLAVHVKKRPSVKHPSGLFAQSEVLPALDPEQSPVIPVIGLKWKSPKDVVMFLVERRDKGGTWVLLTKEEKNGYIFARPVVITKSKKETSIYYQDQVPAYGVYEYRIRAIDLFGRVSEPSSSVMVEVKDTHVPPLPINVTTTYLDPEDFFLLTPARKDLNTMKKNGALREVIRIEWDWKEKQQKQAPDTSEFSIYLKHGVLNTVQGNILNIKQQGESFNVETDLDISSIPKDSFVSDPLRGYLISAGTSFLIQKNKGSQLTVQGEPQVGPCSVKIEEKHPSYSSFEKPSEWGGVEVSSDKVVSAIRIHLDGKVTFTPKGVDVKAEKKDLHYKVLINGVKLKSYYQVGLTASRVNAHGERVEGKVSAPALGFKVDRKAPESPSIPQQESDFATKADADGNSFYTLIWNGTSSYKYNIYRAVDIEVLNELNPQEKKFKSLEENLLLCAWSCGKARVFHKLNQEAIISTPFLVFKDRLPGNVSNRYIYHITAVSPSGVESLWPKLTVSQIDLLIEGSGSGFSKLKKFLIEKFQVVHIPDISPPPIPYVFEIVPQDHEIILRWIKRDKIDDSVTGYRVFKTTSSSMTQDLRNMTNPGGILTKESNGISIDNKDEKEIWTLNDREVNYGKNYYYQIVSVKDCGDSSEVWSAPLPQALVAHPLKLTPPDLPAWHVIIKTLNQMNLQWFKPDEEVEVMILRKTFEEPFWTVASKKKGGTLGWLKEGVDIFYNNTFISGDQAKKFCIYFDPIDTSKSYQYKLVVRDIAGNQTESPVKWK